MAQQGLVTVMVPSYNYGQYLGDCVASAATQSGVEVDVVVVDNGSTDNSVDVGRAMAERYSNVRHVVNADNQGIISSFNRCRDEVRGEFATLLCADDCLTPGALARAVRFMHANPSVGLAYGPFIDFADLATADMSTTTVAPGAPIVYSGSEWIDHLGRDGTNPIRTPEVVMRTSVLDSVGKLDPTCPYSSDLNLWLRIAAVSDIGYMPGPAQALFRRHVNSFGYLGPGSSLHDIEERWRAWTAFFETLGTDPRRAAWEATIRRSLAAEARYMATRAFVKPFGADPNKSVEQLLARAAALDDPKFPAAERIGWATRRKLTPKIAGRFPPLLVRPTVRHLRREYTVRRRTRTGV